MKRTKKRLTDRCGLTRLKELFDLTLGQGETGTGGTHEVTV